MENLGKAVSTDLRVVGVSFSGGNGAGIYCYNVCGMSLRECTFTDTDRGPLVELHTCDHTSIVGCRLVQSRPAVDRLGLRLGGASYSIRLMACSFSGVSPAIIAGDTKMLTGLANDFGGAPVVEPGGEWIGI